MPTCKLCKETTNFVSVFEVFLNDRPIYSTDLCPDCRDGMLDNLPGYEPNVEDLLPPHLRDDVELKEISENFEEDCEDIRIVTQEQMEAILKGEIDPDTLPKKLPTATRPCPKCQTTVEDLKQFGTLGCGHCYTHFYEEVLDGIADCQADFEHKGKKPKSHGSLEDRLKQLRLMMAQAREFENYERAKEIAEEIRSLESGRKNLGGGSIGSS